MVGITTERRFESDINFSFQLPTGGGVRNERFYQRFVAEANDMFQRVPEFFMRVGMEDWPNDVT